MKEIPEKKELDIEIRKELEEFLDAFILYLKNIGIFAKKIGQIEKKYPDTFDTLSDLASPERLMDFVQKAPPDVVVQILQFILRASSLSAKMKKGMSELSAEEKIQLGNEMIKLAKNLSELMEEREE